MCMFTIVCAIWIDFLKWASNYEMLSILVKSGIILHVRANVMQGVLCANPVLCHFQHCVLSRVGLKPRITVLLVACILYVLLLEKYKTLVSQIR